MQILPQLKEAGHSMRQVLRMMRLNDVAGLFDMSEVGARRQLEIFDEMIAKYEEKGLLTYIAPEKNEEHQSMLEAAAEFRMSMAFKCLDPQLKSLIDRHIDDRTAAVAAAAAPPQSAGLGAGAAGPLAALGGSVPPLGGPALGPGAAPTAPLMTA